MINFAVPSVLAEVVVAPGVALPTVPIPHPFEFGVIFKDKVRVDVALPACAFVLVNVATLIKAIQTPNFRFLIWFFVIFVLELKIAITHPIRLIIEY